MTLIIIPSSPFLLNQKTNLKKEVQAIENSITSYNSLLENEEYSTKMSFIIKHSFIHLQRGLRRQGMPSFRNTLVFAVEPLAHEIRIPEFIKCLENRNKITKLRLYAYGTTAFIHDDLSAASALSAYISTLKCT